MTDRSNRRVPLEDSGPPHDPLERFRKWFSEAKAIGLPEPNRTTLATATLDEEGNLAAINQAVSFSLQCRRCGVRITTAAVRHDNVRGGAGGKL